MAFLLSDNRISKIFPNLFDVYEIFSTFANFDAEFVVKFQNKRFENSLKSLTNVKNIY